MTPSLDRPKWVKGAQNRVRQRKCLVPSPICREGGAGSTSPRTYRAARLYGSLGEEPCGRSAWKVVLEGAHWGRAV